MLSISWGRVVVLLLWLGPALFGCAKVSDSSVTSAIPLPPEMDKSQVPLNEDFSGYEFPASIDPSKKYLFYLHGRIIEDQGIYATSAEYGDYEYQAILETLSQYNFNVISEPRPQNTDALTYARKVAEQVNHLLNAGVPANNITIVGASKGAGIAIYVSHLLQNYEISFVLLAICHPDTVQEFIKANIFLTRNVLSIYSAVDDLAGSCQEWFSFSEGKGLARSDEIILNIGIGHGVLYKPMDEWILPTVQWANDAAQ